MILFGDVETTGINVYCSEVITGYFELYDNELNYIDNYEFYSQVNIWNEEAEAIHGINELKMLQFPTKKSAWGEFSSWLPRQFKFACFANPNTQLGNIIFDKAIIQNEFMLHLQQYRLEKIPFTPIETINVYEIARKCAQNRIFTPIKGEKGRQSLKQTDIYKALFSSTYEAHNAKADVKAMIRIYKELIRLTENSKGILYAI